MPLSDAAIRVLKAKEKPYKISDLEGLCLMVKPTGSRLCHAKNGIDSTEKLISLRAPQGVAWA